MKLSLPLPRNNDVKMPIFTFCGGQLSFSFPELDKSLSEFAPNTMPAFDELNEYNAIVFKSSANSLHK